MDTFFTLPFLDCESLIRHMLVVDLNKRYSLNQIKQHKWIIQGEPYDFILEEDEFCFAQHHGNSENGSSLYNQVVLNQMEKLGESSVKVINVSKVKILNTACTPYLGIRKNRLKIEIKIKYSKLH